MILVIEVELEPGVWEPVYNRPYNQDERDRAEDELKECRINNVHANYRLACYRRVAVLKTDRVGQQAGTTA